MATINFLYRSIRKKAFLNIRLLFRDNEKDFVFGGKTKLEVEKAYWDKYHFQKSPKDIEVKNFQIEVNNELNNIENHILKSFNKTSPSLIDKEWLKDQIELYYNPPLKHKELPTTVLKYVDYYLEEKKNSLAKQTVKNYGVIKNLLERFESRRRKTIQIEEVDTFFQKEFASFCMNEGYANNTISRAIHTVKTICIHARYNGLETSFQLDRVKMKEQKVESIYLNFKELEKIEQAKLTQDYLINARDWLIISCYVGQRISDLMRFTSEHIRVEQDKQLIEFTQKKTGKLMTVPLHPKVITILNKRNNQFPRPISDQKYNDYIKIICKEAGIIEQVKGSKRVETEEGSKKYRNQSGIYKKWELVSSHIGRRSFATNFYGKIPTSYLIYITGHSTEKMFLSYIGKSNKDLAMEITNYF